MIELRETVYTQLASATAVTALVGSEIYPFGAVSDGKEDNFPRVTYRIMEDTPEEKKISESSYRVDGQAVLELSAFYGETTSDGETISDAETKAITLLRRCRRACRAANLTNSSVLVFSVVVQTETTVPNAEGAIQAVGRYLLKYSLI